MSDDYNQRLGFEKFGKRGQDGGTFHDAHRHQRLSKKTVLQEVTVAQACKQLLATGQFQSILGVIGGGKEATVLVAQERETEDYVCAKVFRYFTSTIRKRLRGTRHILASGMAQIAAKQEYWNLMEMHEARVYVPKPRHILGNILVMDLITENGQSRTPAPLLRDVDLRKVGFDAEEVLYEALDILADLFLKAHFIHGDYSEHNLMLTDPGPGTTENGLITMDVSQSVQYNQKTFINTPERLRIDRAVDILQTDLKNLNDHFQKRYRLCIDPLEVCEQIIQELPTKLRNFYTNHRDSQVYIDSADIEDIISSKQVFRDKAVQVRTGRQAQKRKGW
ncbi:MAG: RIO1 family regulatory kinase/ATPase domain-containing protein [Candidatus Hodarchaeales archaeon]